MRKVLLLSFILVGLACTKRPSGEAEGTLSLNIEPDGMLAEKTKSDVSQYGMVPSASDFTLTILNYAGEMAWTGKFNDFDPSMKFVIGSYSATVTSGFLEDEGKGKPCFSATENYDIVNMETTLVTLKPTLANCIVKITAGQYVKNYFSSWAFTIKTAAGNEFQAGESDAFFIDAYKFDLKGTFETSGGKTVEFEKTFTGLKAATCYNVVVDLDNVAGNAFTISFNDNMETIQIEEELN